MELFGVGPLEALLVGVIAFILVGPDKFPELARQAGKWYRVARAFTADVMEDVQGAVKEIEAEVDATTGGGLRSIRELTESSTGLLSEARADLEAATSSAQAAMESTDTATAATGISAAEPETAAVEPIASADASTEVAPFVVEAAPAEPVPAAFTAMPPAQSPEAAYGDPFEAAEAKRREAAAREAAARLTGGGA
ncbi:MAG: twin-arginine translocase TatA/TatE family subunit [Dehalococcoidia bacterium]|nr:MAG: twin-arginine translocase TatA/TatE family subunit [Dehalococcoidia bacterium]